jgi:hypothetical protein
MNEYYQANRETILAKQKAYYQANKDVILVKQRAYKKMWGKTPEGIAKEKAKTEKYRERKRILWTKKKCKAYGISIEIYDEILKNQGGRCDICKEKSKLVIDHCHTKNQFRGILCNKCNVMLGLARDNPQILIDGAKYLGK